MSIVEKPLFEQATIPYSLGAIKSVHFMSGLVYQTCEKQRSNYPYDLLNLPDSLSASWKHEGAPSTHAPIYL